MALSVRYTSDVSWNPFACFCSVFKTLLRKRTPLSNEVRCHKNRTHNNKNIKKQKTVFNRNLRHRHHGWYVLWKKYWKDFKVCPEMKWFQTNRHSHSCISHPHREDKWNSDDDLQSNFPASWRQRPWCECSRLPEYTFSNNQYQYGSFRTRAFSSTRCRTRRKHIMVFQWHAFNCRLTFYWLVRMKASEFFLWIRLWVATQRQFGLKKNVW